MTYWHIEKEDAERPGCIVPGMALGVHPTASKAIWGDYDHALRFSRQHDAEQAAVVLVPGVYVVAVEHLGKG